jgi:hypothetical protein
MQLNCTAVQYLLLSLAPLKKLEWNGNFKKFFVGDYTMTFLLSFRL